jgi:hypothetical protein
MKNKELWERADFEELKNNVLTREELKKRHDIRYACFRVQKELAEGVKCPKKLHKLVQPLEELKGFEGWRNFAVTWDVSTPDPPTIVKRMWSIEQEHEQMLERSSKVIPSGNKK